MKKLLSAPWLRPCSSPLPPAGQSRPRPRACPSPPRTSRPRPRPLPRRSRRPLPCTTSTPSAAKPMEEDISANRPFAIMINNIQQALPQCGVSNAEIIYEIPAEGGVTRMMAIFTDISDVEKIGSLRSIRPYYADVGISYDAIVIHAGGSQESYTEMSGYDVDHLDGRARHLCRGRVLPRPGPHALRHRAQPLLHRLPS